MPPIHARRRPAGRLTTVMSAVDDGEAHVVRYRKEQEMTVGDIIIAIIAKEMRVDASRVSVASTMEELQVESLDAIQIIFEIEDRFQISIPYDKSIHSLNCVEDIVSMVDRLLLEKKEVA